MERSEIHISSRDGAEITASLFTPSSVGSDLIFICLPAMGVKAAYYKPFAEALAVEGHSILLCDLRGQGTSNQRPPNAKFGYYEILEQDFPAIIKTLRQKFPEKKHVFLGHSLGGQLGLLHAASRPEAVSAVAIIASGSVYYKAFSFPQSLRIWLGTQSSVFVSALCGYFPGDKMGFGGRQPKAIMRDWAYQSRTGQYKPKGSDLDYEAAMSELSLPVFACSIEEDKFAPHSATDHLISKLKSARVTRHKYTPSGALKNKIDHFRWVKHTEEIIDKLCQWADAI